MEDYWRNYIYVIGGTHLLDRLQKKQYILNTVLLR